MNDPWIYTKNSTYSISISGKREFESGIHAIWAAEVPYIPSLLSSDLIGPLADGISRLQHVVDRQMKFINALANIKIDNSNKNHNITFELRIISRYLANQGNKQSVKLLFLGKIFSFGQDRDRAKKLALDLWKSFCNSFPHVEPSNYPLVAIDEEYLKNHKAIGKDSGNTRKLFETFVLIPIPLDTISAKTLYGIQKDEYWDSEISKILGADTPKITKSSLLLGYFVDYFKPKLDADWYNRLLEALVNEKQTCVVRVSLRPTSLTDEESRLVDQLLFEYEHQLEDAEGWVKTNKDKHFKIMSDSLNNLKNSQHNLFSIDIQVICEKSPGQIILVLESEMRSGNLTDLSSSVCEETSLLNTDDIKVAKENLYYLEHELLRESIGGSKLSRLPVLYSGREALGVFRLPLPPESGYLPGIPVREEPFVRPQGLTKETTEHLCLGDIMHRGTKCGEKFYLSREDLNRHVLIAGSPGSGKSITCLHLLSQLWGAQKIPFLVIYPVAKTDYRLLMSDPYVRNDLLIFTVGDQYSPLRFNPFDMPEGFQLKTHISTLMSTFRACLYMWTILEMLYNDCLQALYKKFGWKDESIRDYNDPNQRIPTLFDFKKTLTEIAPTWSYGKDVKADLIQESGKRIQDLLHTLGSILNVKYAKGEKSIIEKIMEKPTVIELGSIGSTSDIALVIGFLITMLDEHYRSRSHNKKTSKKLKHVTLIEEAHRLMPAQTSIHGPTTCEGHTEGSDHFAQILSEIRGFGEGIMIAEQAPTKLIQDARDDTEIKIMHKLHDVYSFHLFAEQMNLNTQQQNRARKLNQGEAILPTESGYPVLVKIPNYEDIVKKRNSSLITVGNISNWGSLLLEIQGETKNLTTKLLTSKLEETNQLEKFKTIDINQLTDEMKEDIVATFNSIKDNLTFYKDEVAGKGIKLSPEVPKELNNLEEILGESGELKKEERDLSDLQKENIRWFNIAILKNLFPQILSKSQNRLRLSNEGKTMNEIPLDDKDVKIFMEEQIKRFNIAIPDYVPWRKEEGKKADDNNEKPSASDCSTQTDSIAKETPETKVGKKGKSRKERINELIKEIEKPKKDL